MFLLLSNDIYINEWNICDVEMYLDCPAEDVDVSCHEVIPMDSRSDLVVDFRFHLRHDLCHTLVRSDVDISDAARLEILERCRMFLMSISQILRLQILFHQADWHGGYFVTPNQAVEI